MRAKIWQGFSLMEMMIVLLIVAIIAAASAPMVTKRLTRNAGTGDSPWVFTGLQDDIAYNLGGEDNATVIIGANRLPDSLEGITRLFIDSGDNASHIAFGNGEAIPIQWTMDPEGRIGVSDTPRIPDNSVAFGTNQEIVQNGNSIIAIGNNLTARGNNATIIGTSVEASGASTVIGSNIPRAARDSVLIGRDIDVTDGAEFIAIGNNIDSYLSHNSIAIGIGDNDGAIVDGPTRVNVNGDNSIAIGAVDVGSNFGADNSIAIGGPADAQNRNRALGDNCISMGVGTKARSNWSTAIGYKATAGGVGVVGQPTVGTAALAVGAETKAEGSNSMAVGRHASAGGNYSIAIGNYASASMERSIAIGSSSENMYYKNASASGNSSIALGFDSTANGNYSIAIGSDTEATKYNSVAIGTGAKSKEENQIVLGIPDSTVYIPGKLVVGGSVVLNNDNSYATTKVRVPNIHNKTALVTLSSEKVGAGPFVGLTPAYDGGGLANILEQIKEQAGKAQQQSDRRLKNVGDKYTAGLAELKKLDFFHYTFKDDKDKTPRVGVIAQDLEKVFPDAVTKGEDGYLRIRWEDMFYAVMNAVKELDNKITEIVQNITDINAKIEAQNKTIQEQQKTIDELKAIVKEQQKSIDKLLKE